MWTIDLEKVRDDGISIERELNSLDFLGEYREVKEFSPIGVSFTLRPLGQNRFQLDGQLDGQAKGICSRCAEDFEFVYKREFHLCLEPSSDITEQNRDVEVAEDDVNLCYYTEKQFDLEQLIEEQITLALPIRLLCRDECKGVCPECGSNRNQGDCGCKTDDVDPRLAPLKKLLSKK
ncbi:DUF177 domain-containing protein [Acidobacteriota bacterium]